MSSSTEFDLGDLEKIVDLENLPPKVLRQIIRAGMGKRAKKKMAEADCDDEGCDPEDMLADDDNEAEEEREKLSNAAEEQRGAAPKVAVTEDDLPPGIGAKLAKKKKSS